MRILVLDDNAYRHKVFDKRYDGDDVVHAYTYSQTLSALNGSFDLIHLDHDLGEFHTPDTYTGYDGKVIEYNGYDIAKEIANRGFGGKVIIHSVNPVGAANMRSALKSAGISVIWDPFTDDSGWKNDGV